MLAFLLMWLGPVLPQDPVGTPAPPESPPASSAPAAEAPSATPAAEAAAEDDRAGWRLVDRVEMIVNEDILTRQGFQRDLTRIQRAGAISRPEDRRTAMAMVMVEQVRRKLMVQAGKDLGIDPAIVERQVDSVLDRQIEDAGGVTPLSERLRAERSDSRERKEQWTEDLYSITWGQVMTGEVPGPSGRPYQDRYVRPGMRRYVYRTLIDAPEQYDDFGGSSPSVAFQELLIAHERHGGSDGARALADEVLALAQGGADFADLMERFGEPTTADGVTRAEESRVAQVDRFLGEFLGQAEPGQVSGIYPPRNGAVPAFAIARFVERIPPRVPDFQTLEVQLKLEERARENLDQLRREQALEGLFRSAYVWPPEAAQGR